MSIRQFKNYNYNETIVTAIATEGYGTKYLWVAFSKNADGNCKLYKVSASNPAQKLYDIDHAVEEIVAIRILGDYLFLALNDVNNIGYMYSKLAPLTISNAITMPLDINEVPIDMAVDVNNNKVYYLTPGNISGEVSKIIKYNNVGVYEETIELQESGNIVNNAKTIAVDSSGDIWVATYTDPVQLVRIFENSAGIYNFDITEII